MKLNITHIGVEGITAQEIGFMSVRTTITVIDFDVIGAEIT